MQINADNNLEELLIGNFDEIASNNSIKNDSSNQLFYALFDRHSEYTSMTVPNLYYPTGEKVTGEITKPMKIYLENGIMQLESIANEEVDMDELIIFSDFLDWGQNNCQSKVSTIGEIDEQFLHFHSHGAGVFGWGGDDSHSKQILHNHEIVTAVKNILPDGFKFTIIGFDSCLMQSVAVAGRMAEIGHSLLASTALEWNSAWDYTVLDTNATDQVEQSKIMIDAFADNKQGYLYQTPNATLSLVNLDNFYNIGDDCLGSNPSFMCELDLLLTEMTKELLMGNQLLFSSITTARQRTSSWRGMFSEEDYWKVGGVMDVYSFLHQLKQFYQNLDNGDCLICTLADNLMGRLKDDTVIYSRQGPNDPESHGIGILFQDYTHKEQQTKVVFNTSIRLHYLNDPNMKTQDEFLMTQQSMDPPDFSDPAKCPDFQNINIDCTKGDYVENSQIQKQDIFTDETRMKIEQCISMGDDVVTQLQLKNKYSDPNDYYYNEYKLISEIQTDFQLCKAKAEFDNQVIAQFEDNIFKQYISTRRIKEKQQVQIQMQDSNVNINNIRNQDGTQIEWQGSQGQITIEQDENGNKTDYQFQRQIKSKQDYNVVNDFEYMPEGFTNYFYVKDLYNYSPSTDIYQYNNFDLRRIHMKSLKDIEEILISSYVIGSQKQGQNPNIQIKSNYNYELFGGKEQENTISYMSCDQIKMILITVMIQLF